MCMEDKAELPDQWVQFRRSARDGLGAEYRRHLLLLNRERIEFCYEKARCNGLDDAVILVLDLSDERAARMSQMVGVPWEQIEHCCEECRLLDVVPVHVIPVPPSAALCVVGPSTSKSSQGVVKRCAPGTFRVIAIAAGGNSFADFPLPPVADLERG